MENYKPLLKSKTFWFAIISALAGLPRIGARIGAVDPQLLADTAGVALDTVAAVAGLAAAWSRKNANAKIEGVVSTAPHTLR